MADRKRIDAPDLTPAERADAVLALLWERGATADQLAAAFEAAQRAAWEDGFKAGHAQGYRFGQIAEREADRG